MSEDIRFVFVRPVPHEFQRYDTVGDWWVADREINIRVSHTPDWRHGMLVAVHELVEALLCHHRGIDQDAVTAFDMDYATDSEPGDDPRAPYHAEHRFAEKVERMLCDEMGLDWDDYLSAVDALSQKETGNG